MNDEKKYNEALERARKLYEQGTITESLCYVFPELKESEDENIRKELICFLETEIPQCNARDKYIAWLEKQGEHANFRNKIQIGDKVTRNEDGVLVNLSQLKRIAKPNETKQGEQKLVNKIEPKFKVGDIITNGEIIGKVDENENNKYHGWFGYDKDLSVHYTDIPDVESWHKWTIQDAKDGDVLVSESNCGLGTWYCIFKSLDDDESMTVYCYLSRDGRFETKKELCFDKATYNTKPATKEQRDTLEKAMTDAGYTFDFEKKELKKIEQKYWSEEDEKYFNFLEKLLGNLQVKSTENEIKKGTDSNSEYYYKVIQWLKSIRPQNKWKPSDEQIRILELAIDYWKPNDVSVTTSIYNLLEQLKKLKG